MPRIKKQSKVASVDESPDDDSLEGQEPQDTDSSTPPQRWEGGAGGGVGITCFHQNQRHRNKQNAKGRHHYF